MNTSCRLAVTAGKGGKGMGEWMGEGRWRGHNERREKELERGRRSFRFCVFAVNLQ